MLAEVSGADIVAVISRWFHIGSAIVAVGGTFFLWMVLHPVSQTVLPDDQRTFFSSSVLGRWARVVHVCIVLLLLSGFYNFFYQLGRHREQPLYHGIFGLKFLLALVLFFIASVLVGKSPAFEKLRQERAKWMGINIAIAAVILLLSNILRSIPASVPGQ